MLKKFLIKVLDYIRFKRSYAQDGEDMALAAFFEEKKGYKGYFVDVGAHHPVRFSNTLYFYKKGWKGINIDPTPGSMRPFRLIRSRDVNLEMGIGKEEGSMNFYCFNEPALNTFDPDLAKQRDTGVGKYRLEKTLEVPIAPLGLVLAKNVPPAIHIDFFSIDVEGLDLVVLESNDWSRFRPDFILVEDMEFKMLEANDSPMYRFLSGKGYQVVSILKRTIIYKYFGN